MRKEKTTQEAFYEVHVAFEKFLYEFLKSLGIIWILDKLCQRKKK